MFSGAIILLKSAPNSLNLGFKTVDGLSSLLNINILPVIGPVNGLLSILPTDVKYAM